MKANILQGIYVSVAGEAGKTHGLKYHVIDEMFVHLQELIRLLAKYELETNESPNLKEFDIEIFDFKPGSAVPAFRIVPQLQTELIENPQKQVVANQFDELMSYADKGAYEVFFQNRKNLPEVRFDVAEELYGFTVSAGNSPISIVEPIQSDFTKTGWANENFKQIYNIPKFNKQQVEYLLKPRVRRQKAYEPEEILALVQRIGKRKKIVDLYENKDTILSIAPVQVITDDKIYHLHSPLICTVHKEDGNFIIENEMLDLYAAGASIDEAEHDLYSEFDKSYELLNSLSDLELSDRLLRTKNMMNFYVQKITEN